MRDLEHIKLYQGENDDILRRPPSFLVKAGTLLICLTLTGMLILSNYIMIPDMIHTKLVIPKDRIPARSKTIEASFITQAGYKEPLLLNTKQKVIIEEEDKCFSFHTFKINHLRKDTIEVHITIDPASVANFYSATNGDYVLPVQIPINEQSIFSKVISCFKNIL